MRIHSYSRPSLAGRKHPGSSQKRLRDPRSPSHVNEKNVKQSSWSRFRIWILLLIVSFFIFERATVFAAPPPLAFYTSHQSHNSTMSHSVIPIRRKQHIHINPLKDSTTSDSSLHSSLQQKPIKTQHQPSLSTNQTKNQLKQYGKENMTKQPAEANLAFFLQISTTTVNHLPRLMNRIYHEKNAYAIHFDLKISVQERERITKNLYKNPNYKKNVHIMESELITYRGVSMLLNTINSIRLLLEVGASWDYYINISGSDYPLLDAVTQRRLLGKQKNLNYFTFAPTANWNEMAINRLSEMWYDESLTFSKKAIKGQLQNLEAHNPLVDTRDFTVSHCEAWMIVSRRFSEFVVRGDMARKMLISFGYAADSSEHYFGSLAWNHPEFKKTLVPHALRMIIWSHKGQSAGQHPYNIDKQDVKGSFVFEKEVNESVLFFARKFEKVNSQLMDKIDERATKLDVIAAAEDHLDEKFKYKDIRISEL